MPGSSRRPAAGSPTQTTPTVATAVAATDAAVKVACAGRRRQVPPPLEHRLRVLGGKSNSATSARVPTSCSRNSNPVTMPKLPPPPRRPQNSSGFSVRLAVTTSPSAVTIS